MKKARSMLVLFIILCFSFTLKCQTAALTQQIFISVKVNDNYIKTDTQPYTKDGRTYVSLRNIAEALSADVAWVAEENKIIIANEIKSIEMFPGSKEFYINGEAKTMDATAEIKNGRMMVPIKFIAENLDCTVKWDEPTYTVLITKNGIVVPPDNILKRSYTDTDLLWLARIVHVEVKGMSLDTKLAVANVVINRVKYSFGNSIYDVIYAPNQFPPAHKSGFKTLTPSKECIIAAKMALEGVNNIGKCVFFNDHKFNSSRISLYKKMDGMYFYCYK